MRGVFDDAQAPLLGQAINAIHVHGQSGEMHRHDGARLRRDGCPNLLDVDVARVQVDVDELRLGAQPRHHVGAGRKAHGGNDDFVSRTDAGDFESHLQTGGSRSHHPHLTVASQVGHERGLECLDLGAAGQLTRTKYIADRRNAVGIDGRTGKGQKGLHQAELLETRITPAQIKAMPSTLGRVMLSPSHVTDTTATAT